MSVSIALQDLYDARHELQLEKRREQILRENQLQFFTPHPKQQLFYSHAYARYRYARTGNRFGKSEMGAAEDVAFALGYRPWIPEGDPLRTLGIPKHPTKGLIVCTTWKKSREVFTECESGGLGKLFKYIPRDKIGTSTKNHSGFIDRIPVRHISGEWSVIFLDTIEGYKKNPLAQESSVHDWVHVDEPIPEGMWKAIARGLVDRGGRAWFTCTPLTEPWIDMAFVPELGDDRSEANYAFEAGDRYMMTGSMLDNPHNAQADIDSFMSWLTEDEKECRLNGLPTSFAGLVYKEFKWEEHAIEEPPYGWLDWQHPPDNYCIRYAIDYHPRKPDAILFLATSPHGVTYAYHEIWEVLLAEEESYRIKSILGRQSNAIGLVDPLASTPNKVNDITQLDMYRQCGLAVLPATKDPDNGIRAVKALLKTRDKYGKPIFFANKNLARFMFEVSRGFVWDGETNKPLKQNDDMMENLYRLVLQGLDYVEPATDADYQPIRPIDLPANVLDFPDSTPFPWEEDQEKANRKLRYSARYRS